ncbi:MAG: hypothetical protein KF799_12440 [Bdellovibrionales bacterium]|nr:hypothetical protein [Bdellovibrionales bacterium]
MAKKSSTAFRKVKKQTRRAFRQVSHMPLVRSTQFRWLAFGAGVYGILYLMKRKGLFPRQTGAALNFVNRGAETLLMGLTANRFQPQPRDVSVHH